MKNEKKLIISYHWERNDGEPINPSHEEELKKHTMQRICQFLKSGIKSGELIAYIDMDESGERVIPYSGWLDISTQIDP